MLKSLAVLFLFLLDPRTWVLAVKSWLYFRKDPEFKLSRVFKTMIAALDKGKPARHKGRMVLTSFLPPIPSRAFFSVVTSAADQSRPYQSQMLAQRSAPVSFFFCVTARCNYNCQHCSAAGRSKSGELSTADWIKTVRLAQDMGTGLIGFTGGEPLLRNDLEEIIGSMDNRSVSILYTNGSLLDKARAASLSRAGLYACAVSLDFTDAGSHDARRGVSGSYQAALQALSNSRGAGIYTMAQTVVYKQDLDEERLIRLVKVAALAGAKEVRILEPIPSGRLNQGEADIFFTNADREKLISIQGRLNIRIGLPKITTFAHTESYDQYGCGAGTQHSYISETGDLYPCDFVPMSFGNVRDEELSILWKNMNETMGNPKNGCFASLLRMKKRIGPDESLPLGEERSQRICQSEKAEGYPAFYRRLQGGN